MTRNEIETALDARKLHVDMGGRQPWLVRRNGRTQTWKTRPSDFRIPIKTGFKSTGYIDHTNLNSTDWIVK